VTRISSSLYLKHGGQETPSGGKLPTRC
jgi:hypothetical protein